MPEPCGENPQMSSTCATACVICDIDGFTGINDLSAQGQGFGEFCTTQFNNMQYIAFIAGSTNLSVRVDVSNCQGGVNSLEVGFFYSDDCQNFERITWCDTDIRSGESTIFVAGDLNGDGVPETTDPLTIGQHYYLVIDGSGGANCNWTFTVLSGSTEVLPLENSGDISYTPDPCTDAPILFSTTPQSGATIFEWSIDGVLQAGNEIEESFDINVPGSYEVCVVAANVCNEGPPSCDTISVRDVGQTLIQEDLCDGECIDINGMEYCLSGTYQQIITLPNNCDSIIDIIIEVHPQAEVFVDVWICNTEVFEVGDVAYAESGQYRDTILTTEFCDSIVNLNLLVIECEIIGETSEVPVVCFGTATGTLVFSALQGTPPLQYSYFNILDPAISGAGTTDLLIDNEITGLPIGTYNIFIQDDFGNDVAVLQEITEPPLLLIDLIPSDYDGYNISCAMHQGAPGADGFIEVMVDGGVPDYNFVWSEGSTGNLLAGLTEGSYDVTVTDQSGCTISDQISLQGPPPILADVSFIDPNCDGLNTGVIALESVQGGFAPYSFALNDFSFGTDSAFIGLSENIYSYHIKDDHDCILSIDGSLTKPQIPDISFEDSYEICLGDSTMIIPGLNDIDIQSISWTNGVHLSCDTCFTPFAKPVNDTLFKLTITSKDNCMDTDSVYFRIEKNRRFYAPNIFSPNGDRINDFFTILGSKEVAQIDRLMVYDRWGNPVYDGMNLPANQLNSGWNGKNKDGALIPGLYTWYAELRFKDDFVGIYSGGITLVK